MTLPTEEDVLAVLLLWACRPTVMNAHSTQQLEDRWAYDAAAKPFIGTTPGALIARSRVYALKSIEEAVADSERRWAVEQAEQAVLQETWLFTMQPSLGFAQLAEAQYRLNRARNELRIGGRR
jgi:hypothetical protein